MPSILQKKGLLVLLAGFLTAALLIWVPIVGRFSLDDPVPVPVHPAWIAQDPNPYMGRRVQVEGEVQQVYGPRAFALERDTSKASELLVLGSKPWTLLQRNPQVGALLRNDHVQVTGRVRNFDLSEFQKESGRHPSDSLLKRWEGRPVLLAIDIELTPGMPDLLPGAPGRPQSRGMGGSGPAQPADTADSDSSRRRLAPQDSLFGHP